MRVGFYANIIFWDDFQPFYYSVFWQWIMTLFSLFFLCPLKIIQDFVDPTPVCMKMSLLMCRSNAHEKATDDEKFLIV